MIAQHSSASALVFTVLCDPTVHSVVQCSTECSAVCGVCPSDPSATAAAVGAPCKNFRPGRRAEGREGEQRGGRGRNDLGPREGLRE
jgi:hypothetical protein